MTLPISEFERGREYGELLARLHNEETRNTEFRTSMEGQLAELRDKLNRGEEVAEVALEVAAEAALGVAVVAEEVVAEAHEEDMEEGHLESVVEDAVEDGVEDAVEEIAEDTVDEDAPVVVGEEPVEEAPKPQPEPKVEHRRRGGVYGKR